MLCSDDKNMVILMKTHMLKLHDFQSYIISSDRSNLFAKMYGHLIFEINRNFQDKILFNVEFKKTNSDITNTQMK